jgi:hypothetical protein
MFFVVARRSSLSLILLALCRFLTDDSLLGHSLVVRLRAKGAGLSTCRIRALQRMPGLGAARLSEEHLRTPKQADDLAARFAFHLRIPDLRRAAGMDQTRLAGDHAFQCGADDISLEFDSREAGDAFRQRHNTTITACGVRERNDCRRMEIAIGR